MKYNPLGKRPQWAFPHFFYFNNEETKMNDINIYEVPEAQGVFIDAAVADPFKRLVFASLWGRTAAIQTTLACIVAGDITAMSVNGEPLSVDKEFVKKVGKLPVDNPFGDMTHALIYRKTAISEQAGQRDILFYGESPEKLIFQAVQAMSVLPLMDTWLKCLLKRLRETDMLIDLVTICGEIHGIHVALGNEEAFEQLVSQEFKAGQLVIDGDGGAV